jgi:hypothetical protein
MASLLRFYLFDGSYHEFYIGLGGLIQEYILSSEITSKNSLLSTGCDHCGSIMSFRQIMSIAKHCTSLSINY